MMNLTDIFVQLQRQMSHHRESSANNIMITSHKRTINWRPYKIYNLGCDSHINIRITSQNLHQGRRLLLCSNNYFIHTTGANNDTHVA